MSAIGVAPKVSRDESWREMALCAQVDPELWFPEMGEPSAAAKLICGWCEVRAECLAFALANNEQYGVWGGLSVKDRQFLRRALRRGLPLGSGADTDVDAAELDREVA